MSEDAGSTIKGTIESRWPRSESAQICGPRCDLRPFLSEDPIGLLGGINPYTFGDDDPINSRDPTGLFTCAEYGGHDHIHTTPIKNKDTGKVDSLRVEVHDGCEDSAEWIYSELESIIGV